MKKMNKKGVEELFETVIYVILNILFFASMITFIARQANNTAFEEKFEARRIALIIDTIRPGTELTINLAKLFSRAEENNYRGGIIQLIKESNEIRITLAEGQGKKYRTITDLSLDKIDYRLEGNKLLVRMK